MANKMAEFPGKLAIFWQKRPRGGGSPENLKTQGGVFWKFSISGGVFWLYPPLVDPWRKVKNRFTLRVTLRKALRL